MIPSFIYSYRHFCSRAASVSPNLCEWTLILAIGHSLVQWHFQPQLSWWKKRNHSLWISVFGDLELPDNPCNKKEGKTKVELVVLSSIVYGSKCSRSYTTSILAYMSRGGGGSYRHEPRRGVRLQTPHGKNVVPLPLRPMSYLVKPQFIPPWGPKVPPEFLTRGQVWLLEKITQKSCSECWMGSG